MRDLPQVRAMRGVIVEGEPEGAVRELVEAASALARAVDPRENGEVEVFIVSALKRISRALARFHLLGK